MVATMKILKSWTTVILPLSAALLCAGAATVTAQTISGPPSGTSTVAPPWHNPDLDVPPATAPAPPPASLPMPPQPPTAAVSPPSPPPMPAVQNPAPPQRIGTVAPLRGDSRAECREFQQTIMIGGQAQKAYGTACRQADGTWKIVH
jgi:hypothetical protein